LKTLFEKKNNEEWLKNLVEKKEIDADQHTFLKDLLAKRDQVEKSDDTNKWWHNLFEKSLTVMCLTGRRKADTRT